MSGCGLGQEAADQEIYVQQAVGTADRASFGQPPRLLKIRLFSDPIAQIRKLQTRAPLIPVVEIAAMHNTGPDGREYQ